MNLATVRPGDRFGRLTVLKQKGPTSSYWICGCSCNPHKAVEVSEKRLREGDVTECRFCRRDITRFKAGK